MERLFVTYWRMRRILHGETALFHDSDRDEFDAFINRIIELNTDPNNYADDGAYVAPDPASYADPAPANPGPPTFNPAIIDRVTRYEGPLEKAFYRALRELLGLQARRRARAARRPTGGEHEEEEEE